MTPVANEMEIVMFSDVYLSDNLRIPKIKRQFVTAVSYIYNPWSTSKHAAVPLGKATTCPKSW